MKTITDGSAVFTVRDKRIQAMIDMFYPVGSVYISADKNKTKADFPFMTYGTWEEVPANLCLQTGMASEAGAQRRAGLPNITGRMSSIMWNSVLTENLGVYKVERENLDTGISISSYAGTDSWLNFNVYFNASRSNPIYGSSDTVQPPAYMIRAWIRTA